MRGAAGGGLGRRAGGADRRPGAAASPSLGTRRDWIVPLGGGNIPSPCSYGAQGLLPGVGPAGATWVAFVTPIEGQTSFFGRVRESEWTLRSPPSLDPSFPPRERAPHLSTTARVLVPLPVPPSNGQKQSPECRPSSSAARERHSKSRFRLRRVEWARCLRNGRGDPSAHVAPTLRRSAAPVPWCPPAPADVYSFLPP